MAKLKYWNGSQWILVGSMGGGDMLASTYDPDGDGKVESSENSDAVGGKTASGTLNTTEKTNLVTAINEVLGKTGGSAYVLPIASESVLGGVKSGTDITVDASGNVSVNDNSHQHTVSNITNMPTSLPANGGNADTVDNKHASDFALLTHNHTGIYEPVLNANQKVKITSGTAAPSGGVSGDVYLQYV